jgi:predicted flap endonuclease-1-like 5' DNA nuclease
MGVTTAAQVAAWTDEDVERAAAQIKVSAERIRREDWIGQAQAASKG